MGSTMDQEKNQSRIYYFDEFKFLERQKLIQKWEEFEYSAYSGPEDLMEWSIIEVLLLEDFEIRYVGSMGVDYPSFSYNDLEKAKKLLAAAHQARASMQGYQLPQRRSSETLRSFQARAADRLEEHLKKKMEASDASLAADYYLARSMKDPPIGYEE